MKYNLVLIEWLDSKGVTPEWEFKDEIEPLEPSKIKSVGFLIEDKEEYKTIVQSISDNEQILGRLTIPTCSILKVNDFKIFMNAIIEAKTEEREVV